MRPAAPDDLGDGWPVSAPDAQGLDAGLLAGIAPQFEAWTDANVHAILIARHGQLVYERYFSGVDEAWGKPLGPVAYDATMVTLLALSSLSGGEGTGSQIAEAMGRTLAAAPFTATMFSRPAFCARSPR